MNNKSRFVPEHPLATNLVTSEDRRVRRTRQALTHALIALVRRKRFDAIRIQDLLDHADVGRSTFYSHYRGKNDLLLRSFEAMLDRLDGFMDEGHDEDTRLAPVRELFGHVGEFRWFHRALARAHMLDRLYQTGTDRMSRSIARRLAGARPGPDDAVVPRDVMARGCAGLLFALLRWWVDHDSPYTPEQMDRMYHAICLN